MKRGSQGVAMLYALLLMVVVAGVMTLMFTRTVAEIQHSGDDSAIVQTLLLARGTANIGGAVLTSPIHGALSEIVSREANNAERWAFGVGPGSAPDPSSVLHALSRNANSVAHQLQARVDALLCDEVVRPTSGGEGTLVVYFTEEACGGLQLPDGVTLPGGRFVEGLPRGGEGVAAEQQYALPFVMVAEGRLGDYKRNVVLQGEYRFMVGRGSFAKYALFTNVHRAGGANGTEIWFTEDTLFDGPVHTNEFFRFFRNPWFGGEVTSAGCRTPLANSCQRDQFDRRGAAFHSEGFISFTNMTPSPLAPSYRNANGTHAPEFSSGVDWSSDFVPLPENAQDQEQAARDGGLYFNGNLHSLTVWAGDEGGRSPMRSGDAWIPEPTHQYITACTGSSSHTCTRYRYDHTGILEIYQGNQWRQLRAGFNGVLFVDGNVNRFRGPERVPSNSSDPANAPPALARFAQITLAADRDIRITRDLKYAQRPCSGSPTRVGREVVRAQCNDLEARNVLGVFTQNGNIRIGHSNGSSDLNAPRDVTIDGVLMTSSGQVEVENFDRGSARGSVRLLGGIIEYSYGAFGTFNARTGDMSTGYSRQFTYDQRMSLGLAPPYFPTVDRDSVRHVMVFSFGQREQVY